MSRIKLTQQLITSGLICPPGKQHTEFCDTEVPGLYIEVRASNTKGGIYCFRTKVNGKTCRHRLGRTTDISLTKARMLTKGLKASTQLGTDPHAGAFVRRTAITLDVFFWEHYLPYAKERKRSWKRDEELYRLRIAAVFGIKPLAEITRQQIQSFHTALLKEGLAPATCDHHIKLIRQALNLAIDWEMLEKNPAAGVPLFNRDNKVENYPTDPERERLLEVLRTDENRAVCQIATFLLSTGCRLNEALSATWPQFDPTTRVWRIPASNSKSKKIRSVPLNDSALEVLQSLNSKGRFEHVFVNEQTKLPYTTIHKVWGRIRRKAGLPKLRIHDLRHMFASFLINSGRTLYEVQSILGHSDPSVTQRYAHLTIEEMLNASNCASVVIRRSMAASERSVEHAA